jgi:hypothetical protein
MHGCTGERKTAVQLSAAPDVPATLPLQYEEGEGDESV